MTGNSVQRGSLGLHLSGHLAAQTLIGLAVVSLFVFLVIRSHLIARETRTLDEMQALVVHLVEEAEVSVRTDGLEHVLRDQFAGREEARLQLFDADGQPWSAQSPEEDASAARLAPLSLDRVRIREFNLPDPADARRGDEPERVRISLSTLRDDALLVQLGLTLAGATILGTLFVSAAAFWRVRRELESVERLVSQIDALDAERLGLSQRLTSDDQPTELRPLISQFNELLDRLDTSYRQMAAFNADVAHELNTPLATLITSNEIAALDKVFSLQSRDELIGSNLEELQRLRGIVRDMLFLSTAERGSEARRQPVPSLADEICEVIDYHEAALEEASLTASVIGDTSADIDVALVRRAVSNLISNATRHAFPGSRLEVRISREAEHITRNNTAGRDSPMGGFIRVAVMNSGQDVAAEHLDRLFDRFYRVDDVESRSPPSIPGEVVPPGEEGGVRHGLGLSIVEAIARMHRGQPFALSENGKTTVGFTLAIATSPGHN